MSVKVLWDNPEHTAVCFVFEQPWNWHELQAARTQQHQMLNSVDHTVHVIMDFTRSSILPRNPIARLKSVSENRPTNTGMIVLVGASAFIQTIAQLYRRLYGGSLRFAAVSTRDEAHEVIGFFEASGQTPGK